MKYRKKSSIIEAFRYGGDFVDYDGNYCVPDWAIDCYNRGIIRIVGKYDSKFPYRLVIRTPDGDMEAGVGDYIVKGSNGITYPLEPNSFERTYESIEQSNPKKLTNYEWIKSLNKNEMATFIIQHIPKCNDYCKDEKPDCNIFECKRKEGVDVIVEWLNRETTDHSKI